MLAMSKASDNRYRHDMAYLDAEQFQCRQVLAAYYLRHCATIFEIGGFMSPVSDFLQHHPQRVIIADPRITAAVDDHLHGHPCAVEHIRGRFQDCKVKLPAQTYGCAILGYSLKGLDSDADQVAWQQLVKLVAKAKVAVLEYAPDWELAARAMEQLMRQLPAPPALDIGLELGAGMPESIEYPRRRMLVYRSA